MLFKNYFEENAALAKQLRFLRFVVFLLAVAVIINGFFVYSSGVNQKVILVPAYIEGEAVISGRDADDDYLKAMAKYVCFLRLNYTPANVSRQFNDFLKLLSPSVYKEVSTVLYKQKENVVQMNVSSAFNPVVIELDRNQRKLFITGKLSQWTYDKQFITDEDKTYMIKYRIDMGKFIVDGFVGCEKGKESCPK